MKVAVILIMPIVFSADPVDIRRGFSPGEYVNYSEPVSDMRLQRRLELSCSGNATATYRFDMINEQITGKWKTVGDTLHITFDSENEKAGHWDTRTKFLIEGEKLILALSKKKLANIHDEKLLNMLEDLNRKQNAFRLTEKLKCD